MAQAIFRRLWPILPAVTLILLITTGLPVAALSVARDQRGVPARLQANTIVTFPNGGMTYSPANIRIAVGDSVTWQGANTFGNDFVAHPLVSDEGLWTVQNTGASFTFTFTQAGLYHYHCQIHGLSGMVGTVLVVGNERSYLPLVMQ